MKRNYIIYCTKEYCVIKARKPYGCLSFAFDITLTCLTGGLWLIWIFVREMRNR